MFKESIIFKGQSKEVITWDSFSEFVTKYEDILNMDPGIHKVLIDFDGFDLPLYFYLRLKEKSPLLVSFHGANDQISYELPRIDGIGIAANMQCSLLAPCDPLLFMSKKLKLTWYTSIGKDPLYIINKLASFIRIKTGASKTIFYGSSGGGYAAIKSIIYPVLGHKRPTGIKEFDTLPLVGLNLNAVAINPQLNIKSFFVREVVNDFFDLPQNQAGSDNSDSFYDILKFCNLPTYLKKSSSTIYYLQQEEDVCFYDYLIPFLDQNYNVNTEVVPYFSGWLDSNFFLHNGRWKDNISLSKEKNHVRPPKALIRSMLDSIVSDKKFDFEFLYSHDRHVRHIEKIFFDSMDTTRATTLDILKNNLFLAANNLNFVTANRFLDLIKNAGFSFCEYESIESYLKSLESKKYSLVLKDKKTLFSWSLDESFYNSNFGDIKYFKSFNLKGLIKGLKVLTVVVKKAGYELFFDTIIDQPDLFSRFDLLIDLTSPCDIGIKVQDDIHWLFSLNLQPHLSVLEGLEGWLFLDNDTNKSVDQFTGKRILSESELTNWSFFSLKLKNHCSKRPTLFFISNSKETVHPQFYPYKKSTLNVTFQVMNILKENGINLLNPLEVMRNNFKSYYKTDTHWSDYGAYLAYKEVMSFFNLDAINEKNIRFFEEEVAGDLGSKLSPFRVSSRLSHEYSSSKAAIKFDNNIPLTGSLRIYENNSAPFKSSLILFGDSFLNSGFFYKYFTYSFSRVVVIGLPGSLIEEIIDYEDPHYVVIEATERFLVKPGKIFKDIKCSPISDRLKNLSSKEKEKCVEVISSFADEPFYLNKCLSFLSPITEN